MYMISADKSAQELDRKQLGIMIHAIQTGVSETKILKRVMFLILAMTSCRN